MTLFLFFGALVQNGLVCAGIRWLSVRPSTVGVALSTFIVQTLWWFNIQAIKRTDRIEDWLAWALGCVAGALVAMWLTRQTAVSA